MTMWQVLEFQFEVGEEERHEVGFRFNRSLGPLRDLGRRRAGRAQIQDLQRFDDGAL